MKNVLLPFFLLAMTNILGGQNRQDHLSPRQLDDQMRADAAAREIVNTIGLQNQRIQNLENNLDAVQFDYRRPTPAEISTAQEEWHKTHPFTLSTEMPDFSQYSIKIPKQQNQAVGSAPAAPSQYKTKVITNAHPSVDRSVKHMAIAEAGTAAVIPKPAAVTDPSGNMTRQLSDGTVVAIIGGQLLKFKSKADADQFIEKRKAETPVAK